MPDDAAVLTIEFKANLIAPAQGDYFPFRARVLKPGRTITVCDAQAFAVEEGTEKLVASILHLRPIALGSRQPRGRRREGPNIGSQALMETHRALFLKTAHHEGGL
jgi:hypothetical protein